MKNTPDALMNNAAMPTIYSAFDAKYNTLYIHSHYYDPHVTYGATTTNQIPSIKIFEI